MSVSRHFLANRPNPRFFPPKWRYKTHVKDGILRHGAMAKTQGGFDCDVRNSDETIQEPGSRRFHLGNLNWSPLTQPGYLT